MTIQEYKRARVVELLDELTPVPDAAAVMTINARRSDEDGEDFEFYEAYDAGVREIDAEISEMRVNGDFRNQDPDDVEPAPACMLQPARRNQAPTAAQLKPGAMNMFGIPESPRLMTAGYVGDVSSPGFAQEPIIKPREGEERDAWMARCMSDRTITEMWTNPDNRRAKCAIFWTGTRGGE